MIGHPFDVVHTDLVAYLADLQGQVVVVANDPPWTAIAKDAPTPLQFIPVTSMEETYLEKLATTLLPDAPLLIGIGGGTAVDTAKFLAYRTGTPVVFAPTVASVDATFTDAVGVRVDRRVRYVGSVRPREVILDLPLISAAPRRLNRAGIGDILSCHTGLFDWKLASDRGIAPLWNDELAALGERLLHELSDAREDIRQCNEAGVGFLLEAFRQVGAACAQAGHSRFEEGSEHFFAYAYEEATNAHLVHGELVTMCVLAMSMVQRNDPDWVSSLIEATGTVANPLDLDIAQDDFIRTLTHLDAYTKDEGLDFSVVNVTPIDHDFAQAIWHATTQLPRAKDIS
jgi:glycerol-1-phosphate dehydrogenase [NAD(P)+]